MASQCCTTSHKNICEGPIPVNHDAVAECYNSIGDVYVNMEVYDKALSFFKRSLDIYQNAVPRDHVQIALLYFSIGDVYRKLRDRARALSCLHESLNLRMQVLPPMHPDIEETMNAIQRVTMSM